MKLFSSKHWIFLCTLLAVVSLLACSGSDDNGDEDDDDGATPTATNAGIDAPTGTPVSTPLSSTSTPPIVGPKARLLAVNDFLYQLQEYDLDAMGKSAYDLIVMDYSADGTGD